MDRPAYRLIDANFNRAREAIRVVEDYCRFVLNSESLAQRAKTLRHDLSGAVARLDPQRLIAARDSVGDVGAGVKTSAQMERTSLQDCLTAACKRLSEALRVIEETARLQDCLIAEAIEKIRFAAYTLEKDVFVFGVPAQKFKLVRLYIVIASNLPSEVLWLTYRCIAGGADCIQLRAKDVHDDCLFAMAREFARICAETDVLSVINDRPDIAVACGADGVHLGQNDLPIEQVRLLQGKPLIIGKSTHSPAELLSTCRDLPTYVSLGPVFATSTKPQLTPVGLDYVSHGANELAQTGIAHVAIGGITIDNVEQVLQAGANAIAVCAAVTKAPDPLVACRALKQKILQIKGE
jgi:thiamine-phosphate pyrophosphorylase